MAINESIPLFLHNSESVGNGNLYVWLEKTGLKFNEENFCHVSFYSATKFGHFL